MDLIIKFRKSVMFFVKALIMATITFSFIFVWQKGYEEALFSRNGNFLVVFSYMLILMTFIRLYGGFRIGVLRMHE